MVLLFFLFSLCSAPHLWAGGQLADSLIVAVDSVHSPTCLNGSNGAIYISITGGTAPFSIIWTDGETAEDLTNRPAGYYGVTVTDADSTQAILDSIWLPMPTNPVSAAISLVKSPGCNGIPGALAAEAIGGTFPYSFEWGNGETTDTIGNLAAGIYDLTVTDANGCTAISSYLLEPQFPDIALSADGNITCDRDIVRLDGSASILGPNDVFAWSASNGGQFISPIDTLVTFTDATGTYSLTITDTLYGCVSLAEITIAADTTLPLVDAGLDLFMPCTNSLDTLSATASAGTNFTYEWEAQSGGNIVTGGNSLAPIINHAGIFILTVTNTENSCVSTDTVIVKGNNAPPTLVVEGGELTCAQTEVQLLAQLDTTNISWGWTGPNGFTSTELNPTAQEAGDYLFTATDTLTTCTSVAIATVLANNEPLTLTVTGGTITCAINAVELTFTASSSDISFSWTGPNGETYSEPNPMVSEAGDYTLTVTDTLSTCISTAVSTVTTDTLAPIADAGTGGTLTCTVTELQLDGSASSQGADFTYHWTTADGNIVEGADGLTPTVDAPGTYTLTVTNILNGCTDDDGDVVVEDTTTPIASADGGTLTCVITSVALQANIMSTDVVFGWTGPNGFTSNELNPTVSEPGNYILTATDTLNGCSTEVSAFVFEDTIIPGIEATGGTINCLQTQVTLSATSPSPNAVFAWADANGVISNEPTVTVSEAGSYIATATDTLNGCTSGQVVLVELDTVAPIADTGTGFNLDCNVSSGQLDGSASSQGADFTYHWITADGNIAANADSLNPTVDAPGTYTLIVTNTVNGCSATAEVTVTQTPTITANVTTSDATCFGNANGSASVSVSGGAGTYSYLWSNGSTEATASGLTAGTYSITVSDEAGCSAAATATVSQPSALSIATSSTAQSFPGTNDGTATADPSGGTAPYSLVWSNGETTATITDLAPGAYTVTATDNLGCTAIGTANVNAFDCQLTGSITVTNASCFGTNTGEATLTLTNDIAPVQFVWSNGDSLATASGLAAGTYSVTVSDSTTCSLFFNFEITQPAELLLSELLHTDVFCASDTTGSVTAAVNGGVQPYSFAWSNGSTEATASTLGIGSHTLTVTDANGCEATLTTSIVATDAEPPVLVLANVVAALDDNGQATVIAELYDNGSYDNCGSIATWAVSQSQFDCSEVGTHVVTVTITDSNGNETSGTTEVTIEDKTAPTLVCPDNISVGACNPEVSFDLPFVSDNCGVDLSLLTQTGGLPSGSVFPTGTTTQTFEYTDASGNTSTCSFDITVADELTFGAVLSDATCAGACDGAVGLTISGGLQPVTVTWSNGGDGTGLCAGSYSATVSDADGCSTVLDFTIGEPLPLELTLNFTNPVCPDDLTGTIEAVVTGGTPLYSFDWSNGSTEDSITGLGAGVFTLVVTDFQGCSLSETVTLVATDNEAPALVLQNASVGLGVNGSVSLNPALFDAGSSDNCGIASWSVTPNSFDCSNLGDHLVSITATDANGNSSTGTAIVTILDDVAPTITCPANLILSYCNTTASFNLPAVADNCPINLAGLVQTSGLPSGSNFPTGETVQAFSYTDPAGNSATCSFTVTVVETANIVPSFTDATCNGLCNGSASVAISGGVPPISIAWSNGQTGTTATNLCAGAYIASVTDAVGCLQTLAFIISEPTALQLTVDEVSNDLHGTGIGSVQVSINGGTTPYSYTWTLNGQTIATTQDLANLNAGTYAIVVTDGNGCTIQSGNIVVENLTGTEEPVWSEGAALQPNPASSYTQVMFKQPVTEPLDVQVFDLTGQLVIQRSFDSQTDNIRLDLTGLASGVYHIKLHSAGGMAVRRLVVTQ